MSNYETTADEQLDESFRKTFKSEKSKELKTSDLKSNNFGIKKRLFAGQSFNFAFFRV